MVFSGYTSSSGIAGSYSSSIFTFLRNRHTVLHRGCINLRSHQQRKRFLVPPHPLQHLLFEDFVMIAILTDVRRRWYLIVWKVIVAQWYRIHLLMQEKQIWSLGQEEPLEKQMTTRSSILAWRITWTEEPGRRESMGLQRARHDWTSVHNHGRLYVLNTFFHSHPHPLVSPSLIFFFFFSSLKTPHITEIILCLSFSIWLVSLSIMPFRLIYIVTNGRISSFLRLNNILMSVCACVCIFLIHSSVAGHRLLPYLGYGNYAAINIGVSISPWICVFISSDIYPGIYDPYAGSYGGSIFNFLIFFP